MNQCGGALHNTFEVAGRVLPLEIPPRDYHVALRWKEGCNGKSLEKYVDVI
jgi:hypothetical protein